MIFGKHVNKFYKKYFWYFFFGILFLIFVDVIQVFIPKLSGNIADNVIDKNLAEKFKNHKILDIVDQITLSIMDGSIVKYDRESDYYKLVMGFISIPSKIFKKNIDFKKLIFAVDAVLTGGRYNNQHDTL